MSDELVTLRNFIINQICTSREYGIEYKYCLDYIHNYKNDNYRKMIVNKTGMEPNDLLSEATVFVSKVDAWILNQLSQLSVAKRADLLNNSSKLIGFMNKTRDFIKEQTNVFIHRS